VEIDQADLEGSFFTIANPPLEEPESLFTWEKPPSNTGLAVASSLDKGNQVSVP
jgi:hypothetical protein